MSGHDQDSVGLDLMGNPPLPTVPPPQSNSDFAISDIPIAEITGKALVSFSSCQRNLIKTFQIEGMITLITKMTLIFSSDLLNGQK